MKLLTPLREAAELYFLLGAPAVLAAPKMAHPVTQN